MSDMLDNIGKAIEKRNILHNRNTILVYVENEDDVPFWKHIFSQSVVPTSITPVTNEKDEKGLKRGKENVLRFANQAHKYFLLCIDSDYDYLFDGLTQKSKTIKESPFIFQTYTYAIENYKCFAESLSQVVLEATLNDTQIFDYEKFMEEYSEIIYELFIYSVFYDLQNQLEEEKYRVEYITQKQTQSEEELTNWQAQNAIHHIFPIEAFCKAIKILNKVDISENGRKNLQDIQVEVNSYLANLPQIKEEDLQNLKNRLLDLGVSPQHTYLFAQGHTMLKNVVMMFLDPIFNDLKNKKFKEFQELATKNEELNVKRDEYKKLVFTATSDEMNSIERVLFHHKNYTQCFLMRKIEADIRNYVSIFK
jgi:hypothetical protein